METTERAAGGTTVGKIEADMFCADCGYNMHMLDVVRDERLGILLVQCPECGKHHPVGHATGAGRIWLSRLASLLIFIWVMLLAAGVLGLGFLSGVLDVAKIEGFVSYSDLSFTDAQGNLIWNYLYVPSVPRNAEDAWLMFTGNTSINMASLLLGFLGGMGMAVFLPHLKRRHVVWLFLMPIAAACVVSFGYYTERHRFAHEIKWFVASRVMLELFLQCMGLSLGARFGRPAARGLLRVLLSRRMLQHARPLWEADGKIPPGIKPST
jgi:hypothetical protein